MQNGKFWPKENKLASLTQRKSLAASLASGLSGLGIASNLSGPEMNL